MTETLARAMADALSVHGEAKASRIEEMRSHVAKAAEFDYSGIAPG